MNGEEVVIFAMSHIVVDGIRSSLYNDDDRQSHHSSFMFGYKYTGGMNEDEDREGFLIGYPDWKCPYETYSYEYGEIDEDIYLYTGMIVGKNDPYYEGYLREALEIRQA